MKEEHHAKQKLIFLFNGTASGSAISDYCFQWPNLDSSKQKSREGFYEHKLLLRAVTKVSDPWIKKEKLQVSMSLSSVPSVLLNIHDNVKGFSTETAIRCRGKLTCSQLFWCMCAWKKAKVLKQEVRSEDDCCYTGSQETHTAHSNALRASKVVWCNCNDLYMLDLKQRITLQFNYLFFTHTLSNCLAY